MKTISQQQILIMQAMLIEEFGGSAGVRDHALLESALAAPFQSFGGEDLFPTIRQKAARLGYGLIMNHAFIDGNKRIGAHAMLVLLSLNGIELDYDQDDLIYLIQNTASGNKDYSDLLEWILRHDSENDLPRSF